MIPVSKNQTSINPVLIDFGFASKYVDREGIHLDKSEIQTFQGNILFASKHQMDFSLTSRRDDLISLAYILMFLINNLQMPLMPIDMVSI
jgi:hypothetical protein